MKSNILTVLNSLGRVGAGLFLSASLIAAQGGAVSATAGGPGTQRPHSAPEVDVALAGGALALVVGGVLLVTALRRKKLAQS